MCRWKRTILASRWVLSSIETFFSVKFLYIEVLWQKEGDQLPPTWRCGLVFDTIAQKQTNAFIETDPAYPPPSLMGGRVASSVTVDRLLDFNVLCS